MHDITMSVLTPPSLIKDKAMVLMKNSYRLWTTSQIRFWLEVICLGRLESLQLGRSVVDVLAGGEELPGSPPRYYWGRREGCVPCDWPG